MGSAVDSRRIDNVLRKHKNELMADVRAELHSTLIKRLAVYRGIDAIGVEVHLRDGCLIDMRRYWDVDTLVDRFPDCA